jgi:PKD repeat protein
LPSSLAEPGLPAISVTIEPIPEVEADMLEYVHVQAKANVTVSNFTLGALVNVTALADTWVVEVTPSSFDVPQGSTEHNETVSVDIEIPPRASAERTVELRVLANTTTAQGIEYSDMAFTNISVKQYYGLRLSQNGTLTVHQGKNMTHRMRVSNTGNGIDDYTVDLRNRANITSNGLEVEYTEQIYELGEDRTSSVAILVAAAADAEPGTVTAYFRITSVGDPSNFGDYQVTITTVSDDSPPVANASILEDPDNLWTNMSIHFSSNGSYDGEGVIDFTWDFGDGTDQSSLANPVHVYAEPGTYNVTLTVIDRSNLTAQDTLFLTVQRNYGETDVIINTTIETGKTFFDPVQGDLQSVAVMRDGWVAYVFDLLAYQTIRVTITIIGDRPADLYLFEAVHFQTYRNNPLVTFVPFRADGYKQGATGVFDYYFTAVGRDQFYIVIDNKDWPMGTETEGPVDYNISIDPLFHPPVANVEVLEDTDDLWTNMSIHFSNNVSINFDGEGSLHYYWDWGDGTDPSTLADPVHVYEDPGTHTVNLTVIDHNNIIAQDTIVLTVKWNYGNTDLVFRALEPNSQKIFRDPSPSQIQQAAVIRDGWVAYQCNLTKDQIMDVEITIIGDRPVDVYLLKEVDFRTYQEDPHVAFVPFEAKGSKLGLTGNFKYTFQANTTGKYYVVIDNKDWPTGTETEGPVDYTISIAPISRIGPDRLFPYDLICIAAIFVALAVFATVIIRARFLKGRQN